MLENQWRSGLKNSLTSAITNYERGLSKIEELEESIKYYEYKLISVGGVTYGDDVRGVRNPYSNKLIFWLDKIDEARSKINNVLKSIQLFIDYINSLEALEKEVFKAHFLERLSYNQLAKKLDISKNKVCDLVYDILSKWNELLKKKI